MRDIVIDDYDQRFDAYSKRIEALTSGLDEWHARRHKGIGGSEMASVLGLNKYQTAYELWAVKTGREPGFAGNAATYWGQVLEETVAQEYARITGEKIRKTSKHYQSKKYPWLIGNLDRLIEKNNRHDTKILECKTCTDDSAVDEDGVKEWGSGNVYKPMGGDVLKEDDTVPTNYMLQVQHYMNITGFDTVDLAVLFMRTRQFRIYTIHRNEDIINCEINSSKAFWESVLDDTAPPLTPADQLKAIGLCRDIKDECREATSEILSAVDRYKQIKAERKAKEEEEKALEEEIKLFIGEQSGLKSGDKVIASYGKPAERVTVDSERLKEEDPEMYQKYSKITIVSRVLRVK